MNRERETKYRINYYTRHQATFMAKELQKSKITKMFVRAVYIMNLLRRTQLSSTQIYRIDVRRRHTHVDVRKAARCPLDSKQMLKRSHLSNYHHYTRPYEMLVAVAVVVAIAAVDNVVVVVVATAAVVVVTTTATNLLLWPFHFHNSNVCASPFIYSYFFITFFPWQFFCSAWN